LIVACTQELRDEGDLVFVDSEVISQFDGSPNGIFIWFICESAAAKERFREEALSEATRRVRILALKAGMPPSSAETLRSDVTSTEDIIAGGVKLPRSRGHRDYAATRAVADRNSNSMGLR